MLLLGMQSDLRGHPHQSGVYQTTGRKESTTSIGNTVSEKRARRLADVLRAEEFLECSAKQDIGSIHTLFKVIAITSLRYTARAESDHTLALDCGQYTRRMFAWSSSFGTPVTHKLAAPPINGIQRPTWFFWSFWRPNSATARAATFLMWQTGWQDGRTALPVRDPLELPLSACNPFLPTQPYSQQTQIASQIATDSSICLSAF